jgi:hypothetical protein
MDHPGHIFLDPSYEVSLSLFRILSVASLNEKPVSTYKVGKSRNREEVEKYPHVKPKNNLGISKFKKAYVERFI